MAQVPEIIKKYYGIKNIKLQYCKVCLRTSEETKIVKPKNFLNFIMNALEVSYKGENLSICYMCEAQALKAVTFYRKVMFSLLVDMVFHHMDGRTHIISRITQHIQNTVAEIPNHRTVRLKDVQVKCEKKSVRDIVKVASECESLVKEVRRGSQLLQTDTIVVDTNGSTDQYSINKTNYDLPPTPTGPPQVLILDDDDDLQTDKNGDMCIINNPKPRPKLIDLQCQDVIIERDGNMPDLVPMETFLATNSYSNCVALTPDGNNLIDKHKNSSEHYVLHPIKFGVDGERYVPSLSSKLCGNKLIKLNNCVFKSEDDESQRVELNTDQVRDTGQNRLRNILSNETSQSRLGNHMVHNRLGNDASHNRLGNDMVHNRLGNDTVHNRLGDTGNDRLGDDTVHNRLGDTGHNRLGNDTVHKRFGNDTGQNDTSNNGVKRNSDGEFANKRSKIELVAGSSTSMKCGVVDKNIDWEDKIPMDVISFMDATDPNSELILSTEQTTPVLPSIQSSQSIPPTPGGKEPVPCSGPIYNYMLRNKDVPIFLVPESILSTSETSERHLQVCPLTIKDNKEVTKPTKPVNRAYKKTTPRRNACQQTDDVVIDLC